MGHIYFPDDTEQAQPIASTPAPSSSSYGAPAQTQYARCCNSARVDFQFSDPCYVFKAISSPDASHIAASLSNHIIKTYTCQEASLTHVGNLSGHSDTITNIIFPLSDCPYALYSSSRDGSVRGWDLRSGQQAECYQVAGQELHSLAMWDHVVAAGGQGDIFFFDRRTHQPLVAFNDMHMEDVTQVVMDASSCKLITASVDGLIAVHDVSKGLNEDDGFQAALNANTSIEEVGLYGPANERLWVRTGTEGLQLWEWLKATSETDPGGDIAFIDMWNAREMVQEAAAKSTAAPLFKEVDYLIGCHYDAATCQLLLLAGNNEGHAAFLPIMEQQVLASGQALSPGINPLSSPAVVLQGGHDAVVRSVHCFSSSQATRHLMCISAGEDAKLCLWSLQPGAESSSVVDRSASPAAGPARHQHHHPERRRSPY
eukprot:jgi/Chrzof1/1135/Cz01g41150.t1